MNETTLIQTPRDGHCVAVSFEAIPHSGLMAAIEERVSDRHLFKLLRALLRAGVLEEGSVRRSVSGTPQDGVISPLLANVYLSATAPAPDPTTTTCARSGCGSYELDDEILNIRRAYPPLADER
jgi:hypothetical protein